MRSTQVTPGGIRVCGTKALTADELDALDQLADAVRRGEETRRAALTDEERAAEDSRHADAAARLASIQARIQDRLRRRAP